MPDAIAMKRDHNLRIDAFAAAPFQIGMRVERQTKVALRGVSRKTAAATIAVCDSLRDQLPVLALPDVKLHNNPSAGSPQDRIENMRRDLAHEANHFPSRIWVICRCCSAASRNSVSRSLSNLRFRIANISSALFPVAQTM